MTLFHLDPVPAAPAEPPEKLSATRRRTIRQRQAIASGFHPLTGRPLRAEGGTCGDCTHCYARRFDKTYYKCDLVTETNGPGTDLRLSWPACSGYAT